MDKLTFHLTSPLMRSVSFSDNGGLRVQLSTVGGWTEVYDLGHDRAVDMRAWLGAALRASDAADSAPAPACPV